MSKTVKVLSEAGTGYPSRSAGLSQDFFLVGWGEGEVAHHFSFLCCVVFVSFVYLRPVSWVPNVASVSEFLIATSFSSNVYLYIPLITSDGEFLYLVQYPYYQRHVSWSLCSVNWDERWLFVLLILVNCWSSLFKLSFVLFILVNCWSSLFKLSFVFVDIGELLIITV